MKACVIVLVLTMVGPFRASQVRTDDVPQKVKAALKLPVSVKWKLCALRRNRTHKDRGILGVAIEKRPTEKQAVAVAAACAKAKGLAIYSVHFFSNESSAEVFDYLMRHGNWICIVRCQGKDKKPTYQKVE